MFGIFGFLLWIVVGGAAGYIAERIMKEDHPIWMNVALGIVGSFIINVVLAVVLGLTGGNLLAQLLSGIVGACALIWGYREYKKRQG